MCADATVFIVFVVFPLIVVVEVEIVVAVELLSLSCSRGIKENQGTRLHRRPPGISNCGYEKLL